MDENKQVGAPAEEVQPVKTESARCLDHLKCALMVQKLAGTDDAIAALQLIDDYFQHEKSATDFSLDGTKKLFNTADEGLLFPQLEIAVRQTIKKKIRDADQRARAEHYVTVYMERWQTHGAGTASDGIWLPACMEQHRKKLNTDRAKIYFPIAIEHGIISIKNDRTGYQRNEEKGVTRRLLAYFIKRVYLPGNKGRLSDAAVCSLFGEKRIGAEINKIMSIYDKGEPPGHEMIDEIFDTQLNSKGDN